MLDEEDKPAGGKPKPKNLDAMSVGELKEYVGMLETEIQRVQTEIAKKDASKNAAEALFGKK